MSESIKDKIAKLLRLANDKAATEGEATNAMELASAMMLRYNIAMPESLDDDDRPTVIKGNPVMKGYGKPWHIICASAAATLYNCNMIMHSRGQWGYTYIGRKDNIGACEDTLAFLVTQVEALYKESLPSGLDQATRAEFRRTFKFACATRIKGRALSMMEELKTNNTKALKYTGSNALVVTQSISQQLAEVADFMKMNMGHVKPGRAIRATGGNGTMAGFKAGDKAHLHRRLG